MTRDELLALPVSVDVPTAGKAFGISKLTAYRLVKSGDFPVPVIYVGRKVVVPRASLLRALGIDEGAQNGEQEQEAAA